jgi:aldose 1-epimerase
MYRIEQHKEIVRMEGSDGTQAEIILSCGAILNHFSIPFGEDRLNVIDGLDNTSEARAHIKPGFQGAKLSPFVCRIKDAQYSYQGALYTIEKFTMGRHALHGLLFDEPFVLSTSKTTASLASIALQYRYRGTDPGYPFSFDCMVRYTLQGPSVRLVTEIMNMDHRSLPLADGWHPYFTLGKPIDDLELQFHAHEMLELDDLIPTGRLLTNSRFNRFEKLGKTELDNAFWLDKNATPPVCILKDPVGHVQIEISPDDTYPVLQLFTPSHRRSIAIENLSGAPDNFNNGMGLLELQPGEQKVFSTTYTIRVLTD